MEASVFSPSALLVRRRGDRDLLADALAGDAVAFAEVYRRYKTRIHGFCLARLGDADAAADVTQEVFIRVLRSDAQGIQDPAAWLYAIARNAVVDAQRSAGRRPIPTEIDEGAAPVNGVAAAVAHEAIESGHDIDTVMLAMRAIAPRYRAAIILRDIKGLTSAAASEALHTTAGTLDTLLHRARRALSKEHERLSALPSGCMRANELLHAAPAAMPASDAQALEVHLLGCEPCRKEQRRVARRRTLQALLPFLFPLERSVDAVSRVALYASHPFVRFAVAGLAAAAVAIAPVGIAPRPADPAVSSRPPAAVSRSHVEAPRVRDVAARLTAPSDAQHGRMWSASGRGPGAASRMTGQVRKGAAGRMGATSMRRTGRKSGVLAGLKSARFSRGMAPGHGTRTGVVGASTMSGAMSAGR